MIFQNGMAFGRSATILQRRLSAGSSCGGGLVLPVLPPFCRRTKSDLSRAAPSVTFYFSALFLPQLSTRALLCFGFYVI